MTRTKLRRVLPLPLLVLYGLGVTIGAGIYVLIGAAAGRAGIHAPLAFAVAAVGLLLSTPAFAKNPQVVMETNHGTVEMELFQDKAPISVKNFLAYAKEGFYDGTIFHRVIAGFMIQGGCPNGDGRGGPGYKIEAEFNDTHHERGILSMARSQDPNSAGSQFFVCHGDADFLDGQYTVWGRVIEGMEHVDRIKKAPQGRSSGMVDDPDKIVRMRVLADVDQ